MIEVEQTSAGEPLRFAVTVRAGGGATHHTVTMAQAYHARLGPGHAATAVIDAAFRFLLDREPKEAILGSFDVSVIPRYFSDFERLLPSYLEGA